MTFPYFDRRDDGLYKTTIRSLMMTANNIITLNHDADYERVQPQIHTLSQAFTQLHTNLVQLQTVMSNTGFEFGNQTLENDILDYTRNLKAGEDALSEVAEYLSGGLQDDWSLQRAHHLKEVLGNIIENCSTVCKIL